MSKGSEDLNLEIECVKDEIYDLAAEIQETLEIGRRSQQNAADLPMFEARISRLDNAFEKFVASISTVNKLLRKSKRPLDEFSKLKATVQAEYYEALAISIQRENSSSTENVAPSAQSAAYNATLKLPSLSLPSFDGDLSKWSSFRDTYISLIHKNEDLKEVQKFHYLNSCLRGSASHVITAIDICESNYGQAWQALIQKYDNSRIRAMNHLTQLFNFKPMSKLTCATLENFSAIVLENCNAFRKMNLPDKDGFILYTFALRLLDSKTRERFENELGGRQEPPTFSDFADFIHKQMLNLQSNALASSSHVTSGAEVKHSKLTNHVFMSTNVPPDQPRCPICRNNHRIFDCSVLRSWKPKERWDRIKSLNRCFNCLSSGHSCRICPTQRTCRRCNGRHHTLLHLSNDVGVKSLGISAVPEERPRVRELSPDKSLTLAQGLRSTSNTNSSKAVLSTLMKEGCNVLLGTVLARIQGRDGVLHSLRLVIDSGSQRSFITEECARRLSLPTKQNSHKLVGFGNNAIKGGNFEVPCIILPRTSSTPRLRVSAIVIDQICGDMPSCNLPEQWLTVVKDFELADPFFCSAGPVDFLLGADLFADVLLGEVRKLADGLPSGLKTVFGWVLLGRIDIPYNLNQTSLLVTARPENDEMQALMSRFWSVEEVADAPRCDPMDARCEEHFNSTHSRQEDGRYVVSLPFRSNPVSLRDSKLGALNRFHKLELRFLRDGDLKAEYDRVFQDYLNQGFMTVACREGLYFLPHHAVSKVGSTTKLRVVFDASHATPYGSLNDQLLIGPKLQREIKDVLLSFRIHKYAITSDIIQMYLQIIIADEDRKFQHLFYRFDPTEAVQEYEFHRLSFGLSCAPFIALRVLMQLIKDEGEGFPLASKALLRNTYVDDILTGANTLEEARLLQHELTILLQKGGFALKQWCSNSSHLVGDVATHSSVPSVPLSNLEDSAVKVLGMQWEPNVDCLSYLIQTREFVMTKRGIMSTIARMYDPLGYMAPIIFKAKTILQQLWECEVGWDEEVPAQIGIKWTRFCGELPALRTINLPRCLLPENRAKTTVIGFADASSLGYAAVLYLRVDTPRKGATTNLLFAKTRLAPLKPLTIPRLELCAALLLVNAMKSLSSFCEDVRVDDVILLTDSTTVLSWLHYPLHRLKTFVANRVVKILENSMLECWFHVRSEDNAADLASRGTDPGLLANQTSWWVGPDWIKLSKEDWPLNTWQENGSDPPEVKPQIVLLAADEEDAIERLLERFSSYSRMLRVVAYMRRFVTNLRAEAGRRISDILTLTEINAANQMLIKAVQRCHFRENSAELRSLTPYVDSLGVLRVGGRLVNAPVRHETKHPILLPTKSHLTNLLIDHLHLAHAHAGPQLLLAILRQRYWVPCARRLVRSRVHRCSRCHRLKVVPFTPLMGDLPISRFQQGRAFLNTGVDFAGPFRIRESLRRKAAMGKAYVCLFVCLSTKAVHIEVVSQLSTTAFLACLDRFIARRGLPSKIMSDNATNFIGAKRHLSELYTWWDSPHTSREIGVHLVKRDIEWSFIPPAAPHFGGLWEAAVKSMKYHLTRVLNCQPLTFEELNTVTVRIEAILNSRPLYPISASPDDYSVLTPGHFLVGDALVSLPQYDWTDRAPHLLTRWQFLQKCIADIWKKWRLEYLTTLQQRSKWQHTKKNLDIGTLVLLRDAQCHPLSWPVGRIIEKYPGKDGIIRVVRIKTPSGEYTRPVTRLSPLFPEP